MVSKNVDETRETVGDGSATEARDLFRQGAAQATQEAIGKTALPMAVVPDGFELKDYEARMPTPSRHKGFVSVARLQAFVDWALRHIPHQYTEPANSSAMPEGEPEPEPTEHRVKLTDAAIVWINPIGSCFKLVMNEVWPQSMEPAWRDWGAIYSPKYSDEFVAWKKHNGFDSGKGLSQLEFAQFLEDNVVDVVEVDLDGGKKSISGAGITSISRTLEAKKNAKFKSALRTENGDFALGYEENTVAQAQGVTEIPQEFYIAIPIFEGDPRYEIKCRLRYRLNDGAVTFYYDMYRINKVEEHSPNQMVKFITDRVAVPVLYGEG